MLKEIWFALISLTVIKHPVKYLASLTTIAELFLITKLPLEHDAKPKKLEPTLGLKVMEAPVTVPGLSFT